MPIDVLNVQEDEAPAPIPELAAVEVAVHVRDAGGLGEVQRPAARGFYRIVVGRWSSTL